MPKTVCKRAIKLFSQNSSFRNKNNKNESQRSQSHKIDLSYLWQFLHLISRKRFFRRAKPTRRWGRALKSRVSSPRVLRDTAPHSALGVAALPSSAFGSHLQQKLYNKLNCYHSISIMNSPRVLGIKTRHYAAHC